MFSCSFRSVSAPWFCLMIIYLIAPRVVVTGILTVKFRYDQLTSFTVSVTYFR